MEEDDPLDIGNIEIADGMHARAGRLALNARMTDVRATQLFAALPEGNFILRLKFLRETDDDWVLEDKSRKETPQKLTQLSSRSHPRHLVGKRTAQKDITIDTTSDSQVNSNFPNRWSPASL